MTWRQLPAIWATPLRPTDKLVLLCLAQFANQSGHSARPSQATVSKMTGVSQRTVRYALARLKDSNLITPTGKGKRGTIQYRINMPLATNREAKGAAHHGNGLPTIQLTNNPINKKERDSYFDSSSPGGQFPVDDLSRLDSYGAVKRVAARRKRMYGR
jgi:DNA-binding transcriptional ArsR family regulator